MWSKSHDGLPGAGKGRQGVEGQGRQTVMPDCLCGELGRKGIKQGIKCKKKSREKTILTGEVKEEGRNRKARDKAALEMPTVELRRHRIFKTTVLMKSPGKHVQRHVAA